MAPTCYYVDYGISIIISRAQFGSHSTYYVLLSAKQRYHYNIIYSNANTHFETQKKGKQRLTIKQNSNTRFVWRERERVKVRRGRSVYYVCWNGDYRDSVLYSTCHYNPYHIQNLNSIAYGKHEQNTQSNTYTSNIQHIMLSMYHAGTWYMRANVIFFWIWKFNRHTHCTSY